MIKIVKDKNDITDFFNCLKLRGNVSNSKYNDIVKDIISDVQSNGDLALEKYTKKFDDPNFSIGNIEVSKEEQKKAFDNLAENMKVVLKKSKDRIYDYHKHQKRESWYYNGVFGERLGQKITPIENVGVYVPGGKACYPSSVLMNVIPAKVAGVKNVTMVTPCVDGKLNPYVLAASYISDVDHLYKIGGAQAIAALAYGTESVGKVDKIVGPGNIFVALAKREVYGIVGIDSIAGPSEICIIADESANASFLACDLMAQAEHDEMASAILFINSYKKAVEVKEYINKYYQKSSRKCILSKSLTNYSRIIIVDSIDEAIGYTNMLAPEHLELAMDKANDHLDKIKNAGAIFIGNYSLEVLGDYIAGPNHVLPTCGTARFFSPLGVDDFIKKSSIIEFNKSQALNLIDDVEMFATIEGLEMHALSAKVRGE